jgi:hypothetical protein
MFSLRMLLTERYCRLRMSQRPNNAAKVLEMEVGVPSEPI